MVCDTIEAPTNGQKQGDVFTFGSTVNFTCNDGFIMNGESSITCLANRRWSALPPTCDSK